jgi:hypothetical protein
MRYVFFIFFAVLMAGCAANRQSNNVRNNPLSSIVKDMRLDSVTRNAGYEVQIIYTQINRDAKQVPHFKTYHYNVDSNRYFYPASTVKMPLAFLALEKMNNLRASGFPRMTREVPYRLDSVQPYQKAYWADPSAYNSKPTIGQDVRAIFAVSDNDAYNHLFDFLGREYINSTLQQKGYTHTGIVHRFYASKRDQSLSQPITFYLPTNGLWKEGEKKDTKKWINTQKQTQKGRGYINGADSLILTPFDFSTKNWFALTDMERMLRAVLFPEAMPAQSRFDIGKDDMRFLHKSMGLFPREFEYPKYDTAHYWDGYVKFFIMGDTKAVQNGNIRIYNKVGEAYGTLTDVAYIVDFENNVEFILAATILCNRDGVFNDDNYDYDNIGFPFLANLGKAVHEYEIQRKRSNKPDLSYWQSVVK